VEMGATPPLPAIIVLGPPAGAEADGGGEEVAEPDGGGEVAEPDGGGEVMSRVRGGA